MPGNTFSFQEPLPRFPVAPKPWVHGDKQRRWRMPLGRYLAFVGSALLALLFLTDWYLPKFAADPTRADVDRTTIRNSFPAQMAGSRHHRYQPADHRAAADGRGGRRKDRTAAGSGLRAGQARHGGPAADAGDAHRVSRGQAQARCRTAPGEAVPKQRQDCRLSHGRLWQWVVWKLVNPARTYRDKPAILLQNTALLQDRSSPWNNSNFGKLCHRSRRCDREEIS